MKNILQPLKTIILALLLAFSVSYVFAAWSGPTATPPDGNTDAPVNVGIVDQIKDAGLGVNALSVFGNGLFVGYVVIGDTTTTCDTGIEGAFRYNETSQVPEYCDGSNWVGFGTGTGSDFTGSLVNGDHTGVECSVTGGVPTDIGGLVYVCKFIDDSCPAEWNQHLNWSTTAACSTGGGGGACYSTCVSSSHVFSDTAQETCSVLRRYGTPPDCTGSQGDLATCYATIQEVGCY